MFKFVFMQFLGDLIFLSFRLVYGVQIFTQGVQLPHRRIGYRLLYVAEKYISPTCFHQSW